MRKLKEKRKYIFKSKISNLKMSQMDRVRPSINYIGQHGFSDLVSSSEKYTAKTEVNKAYELTAKRKCLVGLAIVCLVLFVIAIILAIVLITLYATSNNFYDLQN